MRGNNPAVGGGVQWNKHTALPLHEDYLKSYMMCPAIALKRLHAGQSYVVWSGAQIIPFPKKS